MTELMNQYPEITWLLLAASSCMGFLALVALVETLLFPRNRCKRERDVQ